MNRIGLTIFVLIVGTGFWPYSTRWGSYFTTCLLAVSIIVVVWRWSLFRSALLRPISVLSLLLFIMPLVIMILSDDTFNSIEYQSAACFLLLYSIALPMAAIQYTQNYLMTICLLTAVFASLINIIEFVLFSNVLSIADGRAAGFFENPNASSSAITAMFVAWLASRRHRVTSWDWLLCGLIFGGIVATFSRAGIFVFLSVPMLILAERAWSFGLSRRAWAAAIAVFLWAGFLILRLASSSSLQGEAMIRLQSMLTGDFSDVSAQSRESLVTEYWQVFLDNPWRGYGPLASTRQILGPHNQYLAVAVDYGIIGLVAYSLLVLSLFVNAIRLPAGYRYRMSVMALAFWLLISSFFSHNIANSGFSVMMIGIAVGLSFRHASER